MKRLNKIPSNYSCAFRDFLLQVEGGGASYNYIGTRFFSNNKIFKESLMGKVGKYNFFAIDSLVVRNKGAGEVAISVDELHRVNKDLSEITKVFCDFEHVFLISPVCSVIGGELDLVSAGERWYQNNVPGVSDKQVRNWFVDHERVNNDMVYEREYSKYWLRAFSENSLLTAFEGAGFVCRKRVDLDVYVNQPWFSEVAFYFQKDS